MLSESNVGLDTVLEYAESNSILAHHAAAAIGSPMISKVTIWPKVDEIELSFDNPVPQIAVSQRGDLLTELCKSLSGMIQFPVNTAYLHALGVVASACTKSFWIEYGFGEIPCNLYIITAQPPSTGKSAINGKLYAPIARAYKKINSETATEREKISREIAKLEKELSKDTEGVDVDEILDRIERKKERLEQIPEWDGTITDATIEGAEMAAREQGGMFNIISAEAESINVIAGAVYGDEKGGKKANQGLILSAWDGEYVNTKRVGRKGFNGRPRSTISVIAQDDSIDTILAAGASGRGLTERFLLLYEKSMLGDRDHFKKSRFDKSIFSRYESLIENILREKEIRLHFNDDADTAIKCYLSKIEPELRDSGLYSNALLTGFMGKADKHIRKLSAVLHVADQWQDGADKSNAITDDYAYWAISIFEELAKTFINASDNLGYVGRRSEIEKIKYVVIGMAEKGKLKTSISSLRDKVKNIKPFKGSRNLSAKLKDEILPILESHNYLIVNGAEIYINPRLK